MVNAVTDIQEDTLVEVVISSQQLGEEDIEIRPHSLSVHSYKTPTFCHFCGELLMGLFKQVSEIYGLNSTSAINPIPTKGGHFGPERPKAVSHFHSFMTRVTIIHDFVHICIPLVPVKPFLKKEI